MTAAPTNNELLRLHREGLSFGRIALATGLSRNAVQGRIQRLARKGEPSLEVVRGHGIESSNRADKLLRRFSWEGA